MTAIFERKVASVFPVNTVRGTQRNISTVFSDVDPADVIISTIYDPKNQRHTDSELGRYANASKRDFESTQHVHLAGPDSTKIGTDLGCTMGAFMNPVSKKKKRASPFPRCRLTSLVC